MHTNQSQYIHASSAITRTIYITKFFQVFSKHIENHPTKPPIARKLKIKAHPPNDHFTLHLPAKMKTSVATLLPNSKQKITKNSQASVVTPLHQTSSRAIKRQPSSLRSGYPIMPSKTEHHLSSAYNQEPSACHIASISSIKHQAHPSSIGTDHTVVS